MMNIPFSCLLWQKGPLNLLRMASEAFAAGLKTYLLL